MSTPATPQLRTDGRFCRVGDFIRPEHAPGEWDPAKYTIYKFRVPSFSAWGPGKTSLEPALHRALPPEEEFVFSLRPWHDPEIQKEIRVWQRVA